MIFGYFLAVVVSVVSMVMGVVQGYILSADVDAYVNRAQVSADRDDMVEYLIVLKTNMEKHGMTRGHTALIFKKADNDMALHYKTVNRILERLDGIKSIPKNETAYQVALDDIRGTLRELPNPAYGWLWVHYTWWVLLVNIFVWLLAGMLHLATEGSSRSYYR